MCDLFAGLHQSAQITSSTVDCFQGLFNFCLTEMKYIDLAMANSEALFNICSLLKQNIKTCSAKETVNC